VLCTGHLRGQHVPNSKLHADTIENGSKTNERPATQKDNIKQTYYGDRGHALTFLDTLPLLLSLEF